MNRFKKYQLLTIVLLLGMAVNTAAEPLNISEQVTQVERDFAATMAERNFEKFKTFLAEETVFFSGESPLRGKQAVADAWQGFYEDAEAPFSWEPETVVALESGKLALSSGPVMNSAGERVATFNSIWRLADHGRWEIVFDKGYRFCEPTETGAVD